MNPETEKLNTTENSRFSFIKDHAKTGLMVAGSLVAAAPVAVFAEGETANAALVSAATDAANSVLANFNALIPIALGVMAVGVAVRLGISFFRGLISASA